MTVSHDVIDGFYFLNDTLIDPHVRSYLMIFLNDFNLSMREKRRIHPVSIAVLDLITSPLLACGFSPTKRY
jgi:hypothetical protein